MKNTWVVVADQVRARIFVASGPRGELEELDNLVHPEGRLSGREINSDRPGRAFDSMGAGRHAMDKRHSPQQQEAVRFAHTVAAQIAARHGQGAFDRLVIVAPPRFLGLLREMLPAAVAQCTVLTVDKDLVQLKRPEEIRKHLPERF